MAKAATEKATKVKKAAKATPDDAPPKKSLRSSVVAESKPEASKAQPVVEPTKPSKKRKAAAEDVEATTQKPASKVKKPRREVVVEAEQPKEEQADAKSEAKVKRPKSEKKSEKSAGRSKGGKSKKASEEVAEVEAVVREEEEEVEFFGFATDDEDSSDDEDLDAEPEGINVTKLPTIAKDDAVVKQKLEKAKRKPTGDRGVIYLGRIPHGFYEAQMKSYFSQFSDVTRLRLSRSKKTGRSKHYAFIEFDSSEVAKIVAETMDNYLLMGHILTCKVIPKDEVHPELWVGANRKWRVVPHGRISRLEHNKARTEEEQEKAEKRLLKRQEQQKRKIAETGIKYDFEAVAYKSAKPTDS